MHLLTFHCVYKHPTGNFLCNGNHNIYHRLPHPSLLCDLKGVSGTSDAPGVSLAACVCAFHDDVLVHVTENGIKLE